MFNRPQLKHEVRETIRGKWFSVFLVSLLVTLVMTWPSYLILATELSGLIAALPIAIQYNDPSLVLAATSTAGAGSLILSMLSPIYTLVVGGALGTSLAGYMLKTSRRQEATLEEAFSGFKNIVPFVTTLLWVALWSTIWVLPYMALYIAGVVMITLGSGVGFVLVVLSIPAYVYALMRILYYSLTTYIIFENPDLGARKTMNLSKRMMKGHRMEYFILGLSFIAWHLLVMVTCGIASIYVTPYYDVTMAAYYDHLRKKSLANGVVYPGELNDSYEEMPTDYPVY